MKRIALLTGLFALFAGSMSHALPIKPNQGEGKYAFCQRMYNTCMGGVFGTPGSQGYNVGRARCRTKWNSCRKEGAWQISAARGAAGYSFDADDEDFDGADEEMMLEE